MLARFKLIAALMATLLGLPLHAASPVEASTSLGKLTGRLSADGQVRIFLGIPYAAPPVGQLRWMPPQPAPRWHGTRSATSFGARCFQQGGYPDMVFRDPGQSEDCLTLNLWAPVNAAGKLPVMVWIHGGGFVTGSASEPRQDGEHLAHRGVVVVSMNYRLGIFGFFAHHELAEESLQHAAGNYGLMDQTAALRWVRQNIAHFGGDPGNVTIFGESAGSFSVSAQMASPLAKGLFVHAIGESGGAFSRTVLQFPALAASEQQDEAFAQSGFGVASLASLRARPPEELVRAATAPTPGKPRFGPNVDGAFLPESVPAISAAGRQAHVPLLAGWNRDEGTSDVVNAPEQPTQATLRATAEKDFGPRAEDFLKVYKPSESEDVLRVAEDYAGDRFIAYSTWAWLEAQAATGGAPVYRYRFDLGSPGDPNHPASAGAFHSDEIEYVFGNLDSRKGASWRPEDYRLSEIMQTYWTNFARTGDPNNSTGAPPAASPATAAAAAVPGVPIAAAPGSPAPGSLPHWSQYNAADRWQVMHLDLMPRAEPDRHRDRYLFLRQAWSKPRAPANPR